MSYFDVVSVDLKPEERAASDGSVYQPVQIEYTLTHVRPRAGEPNFFGLRGPNVPALRKWT